MQLTVNGEIKTVPDNLTVEGLLEFLSIPSLKIAFERNLEIVPRSAYNTIFLQPDDVIEIVHFIGGG